MKLRTGFVSNSSSSSFIVVLPDNFSLVDLKKIYDSNPAKYDSVMEEMEYSDVEAAFTKMLAYHGLNEYEDNTEMRVMLEFLEPYVVDSIDVSSDSGVMNILNNNKLREILEVK